MPGGRFAVPKWNGVRRRRRRGKAGE